MTNLVEEFKKAVENHDLEVSIEETEKAIVIHTLSAFANYSETLTAINGNSTVPEIELALVEFVSETRKMTVEQQADIYRILNLYRSQYQP